MNLIILSKQEVARILEQLEIYGINHIPGTLIRSGIDRIRLFSGSMPSNDIIKLREYVNIETLGLYFAKIDGNDLRLSIDACHLLKEQIKHNILELSDEQASEYLKGHDVLVSKAQENLKNEQIYFVLKYKDNLLGMAKIHGSMIKNYLPKERRRKN